MYPDPDPISERESLVRRVERRSEGVELSDSQQGQGVGGGGCHWVGEGIKRVPALCSPGPSASSYQNQTF